VRCSVMLLAFGSWATAQEPPPSNTMRRRRTGAKDGACSWRNVLDQFADAAEVIGAIRAPAKSSIKQMRRGRRRGAVNKGAGENAWRNIERGGLTLREACRRGVTDAAGTVARLRFLKQCGRGRQRCSIAGTGAPDCAARESRFLCRSKGFRPGVDRHHLVAASVPSVWAQGRSRPLAICRRVLRPRAIFP